MMAQADDGLSSGLPATHTGVCQLQPHPASITAGNCGVNQQTLHLPVTPSFKQINRYLGKQKVGSNITQAGFSRKHIKTHVAHRTLLEKAN